MVLVMSRTSRLLRVLMVIFCMTLLRCRGKSSKSTAGVLKGRGFKFVLENWVVPPGLESLLPLFPSAVALG